MNEWMNDTNVFSYFVSSSCPLYPGIYFILFLLFCFIFKRRFTFQIPNPLTGAMQQNVILGGSPVLDTGRKVKSLSGEKASGFLMSSLFVPGSKTRLSCWHSIDPKMVHRRHTKELKSSIVLCWRSWPAQMNIWRESPNNVGVLSQEEV